MANKIANWLVFENEFSEGQYEIGLDYGNGEGTNQNFGYGLDKKDDSEKGQYLYETFMAYTWASTLCIPLSDYLRNQKDEI